MQPAGSETPLLYREAVRTHPAIVAALWLAALAAVGGMVATVRAESGADRVIVIVVLGLGGLLLIAVARVFRELRIEVAPAGVRFGFGPLRVSLADRQLVGARAERYRWLRFGGWGLRWSLSRGRRHQAYSVPFVGRGVDIEATGGRRYYVSSRQPEELAAAVNGTAASAVTQPHTGGIA